MPIPHSKLPVLENRRIDDEIRRLRDYSSSVAVLMGHRLNDMKKTEGWRDLDYTSWSQYLSAIGLYRSTADRYMALAHIEDLINEYSEPDLMTAFRQAPQVNLVKAWKLIKGMNPVTDHDAISELIHKASTLHTWEMGKEVASKVEPEITVVKGLFRFQSIFRKHTMVEMKLYYDSLPYGMTTDGFWNLVKGKTIPVTIHIPKE